MIRAPLPTIALTGPQALRDWIADKLPPATEVVALNLFCTADLSDRTLCLLTVRGSSAAEVAGALGGQSFAFDSVVLSLPIGRQFACRCRPQCKQLDAAACSCSPGQDPEPSLLDSLD